MTTGRKTTILILVAVLLALDLRDVLRDFRLVVAVGVTLVASVAARLLAGYLKAHPTALSTPGVVGLKRTWIASIGINLLTYVVAAPSALHALELVAHVAIALILWPGLPPRLRKRLDALRPKPRVIAQPIMGDR